MSSFNLHKITPNSWIANTSGTPVAFVYKRPTEDYPDTLVYMASGETRHEFKSMIDLKVFLGGKVSEQIDEAGEGLDADTQADINGFPVKHGKFVVESMGSAPVYLRGKSQHVAGYWCIKFSKRWVPSLCPLLRTTEQYQSSGPFKTRLEMMNALASMNRQS